MMLSTRTTPLPRVWRWLAPLRIRMLREQIASEEQYLRDLQSGGVMTDQELDRRRANITPLRVELRMWEEQL